MYKKFHIYATFAICIPILRGLYKQDTDPFEALVGAASDDIITVVKFNL
jgi:hypothetical protein